MSKKACWRGCHVPWWPDNLETSFSNESFCANLQTVWMLILSLPQAPAAIIPKPNRHSRLPFFARLIPNMISSQPFLWSNFEAAQFKPSLSAFGRRLQIPASKSLVSSSSWGFPFYGLPVDLARKGFAWLISASSGPPKTTGQGAPQQSKKLFLSANKGLRNFPCTCS